jgi:hypothetical protein
VNDVEGRRWVGEVRERREAEVEVEDEMEGGSEGITTKHGSSSVVAAILQQARACSDSLPNKTHRNTLLH